MIEKITIEDLIEEVYTDQLDLLKDSYLSAKEKSEKKELIKENILHCENLEEMYDGLKKLGYSHGESNEYLLSLFIES